MKISILLLISFFFLSSCGYQIGLSQSHKNHKNITIDKIYIKPLKNKTSEISLGIWLTEEIRNEFIRNGGSVVKSLEEARFILEGEIKSIDTSGISFVRYDKAVERRINVMVSMKLMDKNNGEILWKDERISREESFFVGREIMETEGLKDDALKRLSLYLARYIYHVVGNSY